MRSISATILLFDTYLFEFELSYFVEYYTRRFEIDQTFRNSRKAFDDSITKEFHLITKEIHLEDKWIREFFFYFFNFFFFFFASLVWKKRFEEN